MSRFFWLEGLDDDLREHVLFSLRVLWTQTSNALEGNTFSEGDTLFFLKEGLTVSGKTLQEHLAIQGHSDAVKELLRLVTDKDALSKEDLFALHRLVQTEQIIDAYRPIGRWKCEDNETQIQENGKIIWHEYQSFILTPKLMEEWIARFAELSPKTREEAMLCYAKSHLSFVSIHPFADGNGRMARLVSNFPLLRNGFPPILIARSEHRTYLDLCHSFQKQSESPFPTDSHCLDFISFLETQWNMTWEIIDDARQAQNKRQDSRSSTKMLDADAQKSFVSREKK